MSNPPARTIGPRAVAGLIAGALACALGALILGEYQFEGLTAFAVGLLFGLVIAELVLGVGGTASPVIAIVTALCVAGGLGWAAWISSGKGLRPYPAAAWVAIGVGAVVAAWRTGGWARDRDPELRSGE